MRASPGPDFNPRSPHGERRCCERKQNKHPCISIHAPRTGSDALCCVLRHNKSISIHAPRTGSDPTENYYERSDTISIHAPRTGSDQTMAVACRAVTHFNPRSPHGERLRALQGLAACDISIHAPRTGSDWYLRRVRNAVGISIHAPRTGSDRRKSLTRSDVLFQSTLPARGATSPAPQAAR